MHASNIQPHKPALKPRQTLWGLGCSASLWPSPSSQRLQSPELRKASLDREVWRSSMHLALSFSQNPECPKIICAPRGPRPQNLSSSPIPYRTKRQPMRPKPEDPHPMHPHFADVPNSFLVTLGHRLVDDMASGAGVQSPGFRAFWV